jgi:hypothetical protein
LHDELTAGYAVENLDYLVALQELSDLANQPGGEAEFHQKADELNRRFVSEDATQPINIDYGVAEELRPMLGDKTISPADKMKGLEPSKNAIRELILLERVPAMRNSDAFKAAMNQLRAEEQKLQNATQRVNHLEKKLDRLETSKWERFKAQFQGGVKKVQEKANAELTEIGQVYPALSQEARKPKSVAIDAPKAPKQEPAGSLNEAQRNKHRVIDELKGKIGTPSKSVSHSNSHGHP